MRGDRGEHQEAGAPAGEGGDLADDEAAAEAADDGAEGIGAGEPDRLGAGAFVADIGHGDGEDEREQQPLQEAPGDHALEAARGGDQQGGQHQGAGGGGDERLAPQPVGDGADERGDDGDREQRRGDGPAGARQRHAELQREHRQDGLRRVEVDEGAEPGGGDAGSAAVRPHGGSSTARQAAGSGGRRRGSGRRRGRLGEPPGEGGVAAVAGRRGRGLHAVRLVGGATEADVHVGGVAPPGADQVQPGPVAGDRVAELPLDGEVDQDAIDVRQAGGQAQQGDLALAPQRGVEVAMVGQHQAGRVQRVALVRRRREGEEAEIDVGVDAELVAEVAAGHRAAARLRDVAHGERGQAGGAGPQREGFQGGDGRGGAPEAAAAAADGGEAWAFVRELDGAGDAAGGLAADDVRGGGGHQKERQEESQVARRGGALWNPYEAGPGASAAQPVDQRQKALALLHRNTTRRESTKLDDHAGRGPRRDRQHRIAGTQRAWWRSAPRRCRG